jgi:hypothetical protein
MTLTIELPQATIERVQAEAQARGMDVAAFVREAVEAKLSRPKRTLAEVLNPIHDAVEASRFSESEVNALLEHELKARRTERRSGRAQP